MCWETTGEDPYRIGIDSGVFASHCLVSMAVAAGIVGYEMITRRELNELAKQQGQHRFGRELWEEYRDRVMSLKAKRDKHHEPWRRDMKKSN